MLSPSHHSSLSKSILDLKALQNLINIDVKNSFQVLPYRRGHRDVRSIKYIPGNLIESDREYLRRIPRIKGPVSERKQRLQDGEFNRNSIGEARPPAFMQSIQSRRDETYSRDTREARQKGREVRTHIQ